VFELSDDYEARRCVSAAACLCVSATAVPMGPYPGAVALSACTATETHRGCVRPRDPLIRVRVKIMGLIIIRTG
jgi:hypothetical protein